MNEHSDRKYVIQAIFIVVVIIFILRLFYIQVIDDSYLMSAQNNVLRQVTIYPSRGLIKDRHEEILVHNQPIYDLLVVPRQIKNIDTMSFCQLAGISTDQFLLKMSKAIKYSRFKASLFEPQIPTKEFAKIQERLFEFPGFYTETRPVRNYFKNLAPHVLGYLGEVNQHIIESSGNYYKKGDYSGISGIEQYYEKYLRGKRGIKNMVVDVHNRLVGSFKDQKYDTAAVSGINVWLSIDAGLQEYGEKLMQGKSGSIVAIEPKTGEILAMISAPGYDPNFLTGRKRGENYTVLNNDPEKPLFNRAIMAQYPPGSVFKLILALIGQMDGVINSSSRFPCSEGYRLGNLKVGCHEHTSMLNLHESIQHSCNAYYCEVFRRILNQDKYSTASAAYEDVRKKIMSFGLNQPTGIDLPNELKGILASVDYYNKVYGKYSWKFSNIISLSIGQGEIGMTTLQLANLAAIIANKGFYYTPHLIKNIETIQDNKKGFPINYTLVNKKEYYELVINAMEDVVMSGTAQLAKVDGISICGKTGTAQNPHGEDHSIFIAFAPKENPKIAIAAVVENAGFGGVWAAPISGLLIEKYFNDTISKSRLWVEDRVINTTFSNK